MLERRLAGLAGEKENAVAGSYTQIRPRALCEHVELFSFNARVHVFATFARLLPILGRRCGEFLPQRRLKCNMAWCSHRANGLAGL